MSGTVVLLLALVGSAYLMLVLIAATLSDRLILPAPASSYRSGAFEEFHTLETADGVQLAAVHLPNPQARYTILYSHGNGEDLGNILPVLEMLHGLGFGVYGYDYRGYGLSAGEPSVKGILRDSEAAYAHLTGPLGVAPERVILWGRSVGGGPAVHLAAHQPVAGVVLEASFTSAFCVVTRRPILPFDRLANIKLMDRVRVPLLVIHGRRDRVVPFSHGVRLFDAAGEPKRSLWIDEGGHNDLWLVASERIGSSLRDFAELVERSAPVDPPRSMQDQTARAAEGRRTA